MNGGNTALGIERVVWDPATAWERYCGFLDVPLDTFMEIQSHLLMEQVQLVSGSRLGRRLLRFGSPASVEEFRQTVPLTTYADYVRHLDIDDPSALPSNDYIWVHTTGAQAGFKHVPYTRRAFTRFLDNLMAAFILATASKRGEVRLQPGDTVMHNVPPRPYLSGLAAFGLVERFGLRGVIDPAEAEDMEFRAKIRANFREALRRRVDIIIAMTSVLVRVGQSFEERPAEGAARSDSAQDASGRDLNLRSLARRAVAKARSVAGRRPIRPRDLWPTKAVIGWGVDTPFFRQQVAEYWGTPPFELYACTEGGAMGMHTWERRGMVFNPYMDFYEFIHEDESRRAREDDRYTPRSVLLDEVAPDNTYEVVISNFYGMPLLRYRVGHLVRFFPEPPGGWTHGPEFEFIGRGDDRMDVGGFTRIDEKTVWEAMRHAGLEFTDWSMARDYVGDRPTLHLLAEARAEYDTEEATAALHRSLTEADAFYRDLEEMLGIRPLRLTLLSPGTFDRYYDEKLAQGEPLGRRRPPRMNAFQDVVDGLIRLSGARGGKR